MDDSLSDSPEARGVSAMLDETLRELAEELAHRVGREVPESGDFRPVVVRAPIEVKTHRGRFVGQVELHVLAMRAEVEREFGNKRLVSVRVASRGGQGFVSRSCFHGTHETLQASLLREAQQPAELRDAVEQLALGLPVETDDALWR